MEDIIRDKWLSQIDSEVYEMAQEFASILRGRAVDVAKEYYTTGPTSNFHIKNSAELIFRRVLAEIAGEKP